MAKSFKSEIVDMIIFVLEGQMKKTNRHLLKTDTIRDMCSDHIDLSDELTEREELLDIGIKQVIQSRLFAHNYFSVQTGYFVNVNECENLGYLNLMLKSKDNTIKDKIAVRNQIKKLKGLDGQMTYVPDENNFLTLIETKTTEEIIADLEADAV